MADVPEWAQDEVPAWAKDEAPAWAKPEVGVAEDTARTVAPSALRGTLNFLTTPANVMNLPGQAAEYVANKFPEAHLPGYPPFSKFFKDMRALDTDANGKSISEQHTLFPSYETALDRVQQHTGQLYEPQHLPGRVLQGAVETAPQAALGGEGAIIAALRSAGAGAGGELGNQVAKILPEGAQPWARAAGNILGYMGGPRALTWNPMTAEQLAATSTLSPEMKAASMAGQWTDSPFWRGMETYSKKGANAPAKQAEVFTQDALKRADHQGPLKDIGDTLDRQAAERENIQFSNEINPAELLNLQAKNAIRSRPLQNASANVVQTSPYSELEKDIYFGPRRGQTPQPPPPTTIPGERYQNLKDSISAQMNATGATRNVRDALHGMRNDLDTAWENSIGPTTAAEYNNLGKQMQAGMTVREAIPNVPNTSTINPNDLYKEATKRYDRPMADYAENSARVMTDMPPRAERAPAWFNLLNTAGAGLLGAGAGAAHGGLTGAALGAAGAAGVEKMVLGHLIADALWRGGAGAVGKVAASPPVQFMAKNQIARPPGGGIDPRVLATVNALRLSPAEERGQLPAPHAPFSQ